MVGDLITVRGVAYEVVRDGSREAPSLLSDYSRGSTLAGVSQRPARVSSQRDYDADRMKAEALYAPSRKVNSLA